MIENVQGYTKCWSARRFAYCTGIFQNIMKPGQVLNVSNAPMEEHISNSTRPAFGFIAININNAKDVSTEISKKPLRKDT